MSAKDNPQNVIDSYRKRQRMTPFIVWGAAVLLVAVGVILLITSVLGGGGLNLSLFASDTPTVTVTVTPSPTNPPPTATNTPTETLTPTITLTSTPSAPFTYKVQANDTCFDLAEKFGVNLRVLLAINNFPAGQCPIVEGQDILIPLPEMAMPTETALPEGFRGVIAYEVKPGETLAMIVAEFNSTADAIIAETNRELNLNPRWEDPNEMQAGDIVYVPVNIVTATPTLGPTRTPAATNTLSVVIVTQTPAIVILTQTPTP